MCRNHVQDNDVTSTVPSLADPFDRGSGGCQGLRQPDPMSRARPVVTAEDALDRSVEVAVVNALFAGDQVSRRNFMRLVGSATAMSIISAVFPLEAAKALAQDASGSPEKKDLKIGFMPITCASPLIAAEPAGIYKKHGLEGAKVVKAQSWTMIRDWTLSKEVDCAHMLSPMPLAMTLGADTTAAPFVAPAIQNINGQAITLGMKHKGVKGPQDMKGLVFAVPFDYSMHNFLLRYFLAEGGVDPDKDVTIRILPPPQMVLYLKSERIDGFLSPDPFNQRAVYDGAGFIFMLSKEIWPGHPCCAFGAAKSFPTQTPNSFKAMFKAIVEAALFAHKAENRKEIAKLISGPDYLNQPTEVVEQVLTGVFPDGLGKERNEPDRIDFNPLPLQSMAVWILTQMKRWGYLKGDVNYKTVAQQVFLTAECADIMKKAGASPPAGISAKHSILGKEFDPDAPQQYLNSFTIGQK